MNEQNLKKGGKAHRLTVEEQSRGGRASAQARRKRADIKKTVQAILDGEYKDENGEPKTGAEMLAIALFAVASDPKHKQCIQAQRLIYELTGQDKTPEDKKRIKQALKIQEKEIEFLQKKIDKDDDW